MVIFPREGAVKSFVECFAVLFVPFDSSQDHLRVGRGERRRDHRGKRGETKEKRRII